MKLYLNVSKVTAVTESFDSVKLSLEKLSWTMVFCAFFLSLVGKSPVWVDEDTRLQYSQLGDKLEIYVNPAESDFSFAKINVYSSQTDIVDH